MNTLPDYNLPKTEEAWKERAKTEKLPHDSIHDFGIYASASEIDLHQFLHLRILWISSKQESFERSQERWKWLSDKLYQRAKVHLRGLGSNSWKLYLESFKIGPSTFREMRPLPYLGTFDLVRYYQCQVERLSKYKTKSSAKVLSPPVTRARAAQAVFEPGNIPSTPTPSGRAVEHLLGPMDSLDLHNPSSSAHLGDQPHSASSGDHPHYGALSDYSPVGPDMWSHFTTTEDEQIVNTALILFLNAITMHCREVQGDWTLHRRAFTFANPTGSKLFEARVDGYLRALDSDEVKAILEVKPYVRSFKAEAVRMQEGAQMAAWINSHHQQFEKYRKGNGYIHLLLISQDRHEVYLSFARFNIDYVDYLTGRTRKWQEKPAWLEMHEFGPFVISNGNHMAELAFYVLAYSMERCPKG